MRKLHQVALVVAAASGLSAIGASASSADAPAGFGGGPPAAPQRDTPPQAGAWSASGATSHTSGSHASPQQAAAPQSSEQAPEVSPQLNPQLNPQLSPQVSQVLPQSGRQSGPEDQNNLFRPYQECSPQNFLDANVPIGLLATPETRGFNCTQANTQANAFATAKSGG